MNKINNYPTLVIPKGRLYTQINEIIKSILGKELPNQSERRCFWPNWFNELNIFIAKPKSIPQLIETGICEYGFCGKDIIKEHQFLGNIDIIKETHLNEVDIVLACKVDLNSITNRPIIIATEFPHIAEKYFTEKLNKPHYILNTAGSTEGYADLCADCIIDVCETEKSLKENGFDKKIYLFKSSTCLIKNRDSKIIPLIEKLMNI